MTDYIKCSVLNRSVEFKKLESGYISVGVDGTLIGNYPTARQAILEAADHVRLIEREKRRPTIPEAVWQAVEAFGSGVEVNAAVAFDLKEIGRCQHRGQTWVVFDDGAYRHVVEASHFDNSGRHVREADDERRAADYTEWCRGGTWATDEIAAEVAGLCDLTHVHSAQSGTCGRVDAATMVEVTIRHQSSLPRARWCQPVGWTPRNTIDGADWSDSDGCWWGDSDEEAGVILLADCGMTEGETVTVNADDLRVASSGDCRVIGKVEVE